MIAVKVTNVKNFMSKLLAQDCFDRFLLAEASISTYNTFVIDGHQIREFYSADEWQERENAYEFSTWSEMRSMCFDLIKGKHTPVAFRFTLYLKPEFNETILDISQTGVTPSQVRAFVLNIRYEKGSLSLTTGTSFATFLMDKTPDELWDTYVLKFLGTQDISFEEL